MVVLMLLAMFKGVVAAVRLQHVSTLLRQDDGHVPMTSQALGSDEPFLAKVPEVARPRIGRTPVVVAEVACRDDSKRADGRKGAGFRAPQGVLAVPGIVDDLSVRPARQVEVPHEHVSRIEALVSISRVAVALESSRVIVPISAITFRVVVSRTGRDRTPTQRERVLIVTIAPVVVSPVSWIATPARIVRHIRLR
jgi:hypothetical protein